MKGTAGVKAAPKKRWRQPVIPLTAAEWLSNAAPVQATRMLEVSSLNVLMLSDEDLNMLISAEEEFYKGLQFPIQRISLPVPLDLDAYLSDMHKRAAADDNPKRAELTMSKARQVERLVNERELVEWRKLIIFPVEPNHIGDRVQYLRSCLQRIGLSVRELELYEGLQVWYEILDPDRAAIDKIRPLGVLNNIPSMERIVPTAGFNFLPGKQFNVGTKACRVLAVVDYPRNISLRAFIETYNLERQVVIIQHIHPTDSSELAQDVSKSLAQMGAELEGLMPAYKREEMKAQHRDAQKLIRKLAGENQQVLDLCTYLLVRADSVEQLNEICDRLATKFRSKGFKVKATPIWRHQEAFKGCLPMAHDPMRRFAKRNLPAASMPVTFAYNNAELTYGRGYVWGINKDTGNLVLIDPWDLMNAHVVFIGTSGSGKTFTMNEFVIQAFASGVEIRSLDIEGDKGRLCAMLNGQRVRIAPQAGNYINPMEVRKPPADPSKYRDVGTEEHTNGLAAIIQRQKVLFSLMLPNITPEEDASLDQVLIECYDKNCINFDTDYASVKRDDWPTWTDLYALLCGGADTGRMASVLKPWVTGSLSGMFDQPTNVNLDNQFVVLDIHDVMALRSARGSVFFMAMCFLWDEINRDWQKRKILDTDEIGVLADSEDALEFFWRISKMARRRNCRLQLATQDPMDFLIGKSAATQKYALGIISNCATKVIGRLERKATEYMEQAVKLSESTKDLISRLALSEKIILAGDRQAHIEVVASLEELNILDPRKYEEIMGQEGAV